jgi:hypothetical protein
VGNIFPITIDRDRRIAERVRDIEQRWYDMVHVAVQRLANELDAPYIKLCGDGDSVRFLVGVRVLTAHIPTPYSLSALSEYLRSPFQVDADLEVLREATVFDLLGLDADMAIVSHYIGGVDQLCESRLLITNAVRCDAQCDGGGSQFAYCDFEYQRVLPVVRHQLRYG